MEKVDLTTALEYILGTSKIKSPEQLKLLISALEEMGDKELDMEAIEKVVAKVKGTKEA